MRGFLGRLVQAFVYEPDPIGSFTARHAAAATTAALTGRTGFPHYDMPGSPALTFAGYVASPQKFQGRVQLGAIENPPVIPYPALPAAQVPPAIPTWLSGLQGGAG